MVDQRTCDLMVAAFGDKGERARWIGVAYCTLDSAMEVEALFEVS